MITKDFNFKANSKCTSISVYKDCIAKYYEGFDNAKNLRNNICIFLDTNILLRYYSISFAARKKFLDFLNDKKGQIVISSQVQQEFIKNREKVINDFFEKVTNQIPSLLNSQVINPMQTFINSNKDVLKDYPEVETSITEQLSGLSDLVEGLKGKTVEAKNNNSDLVYKDDLLDFIVSCSILDPLDSEELNIVEKVYLELCNAVKDKSHIKDYIKKNQNDIFPGIGDISEKRCNSSGDFIIYHEMMKYMKDNNIDVAFLTFDTTKGDWMKFDKTPYLHYVLNTYNNFNRLLYILDADR